MNGKVIGSCLPRHRAKEFIRFLNHLEKEVPSDQVIHLIMDNYSTHKGAAVQRWLMPKKRCRYHFHFASTSSSWLNQVERLFGLIADRMIRRGTFHCVDELERAIYQWLANWNNEPKPFEWKGTAEIMLDKVRRCRQATVKN
jgi:transposase